ncbi:MAG TPA: hypothetical protein VHB21_24730, partial [Minicystis sp.]|nr:hypothetical protein [Minicystis sp.]
MRALRRLGAVAVAVVASALGDGAARADGPAPGDAQRATHDVTTELLDAEIDLAFAGRHFGYSDPVSTNIRDYRVFGAPMPGARVALYPLAGARVGFLRDVGVFGGFSAALGLDSKTSDGTPIGTT